MCETIFIASNLRRWRFFHFQPLRKPFSIVFKQKSKYWSALFFFNNFQQKVHVATEEHLRIIKWCRKRVKDVNLILQIRGFDMKSYYSRAIILDWRFLSKKVVFSCLTYPMEVIRLGSEGDTVVSIETQFFEYTRIYSANMLWALEWCNYTPKPSPSARVCDLGHSKNFHGRPNITSFIGPT